MQLLVAPRRMPCVPPERAGLDHDPRTAARGRGQWCGPGARLGNGAWRSRRLATAPAGAIRPAAPEPRRPLPSPRPPPGGQRPARGAPREWWPGWPCGAGDGGSAPGAGRRAEQHGGAGLGHHSRPTPGPTGLDRRAGRPARGAGAPGGAWTPIAPGLGATLEGVGAQARAVRQRPGTEPEPADAAGLADRFAHGLGAPRWSPPSAGPAGRARPRTRVALGPPRPQGPQRRSQGWEETNRPRAQALSARCGPRGRRRRKAWWGGERTPPQRAALAMGP
jgi:hypothetical protein